MTATPTAPPGLAETFGLIIGGLCKAAAVRMCADPSVRPPLLLIHAWLKRLVQKFAALVARAEAGTLRPPRPGRHRAPAKNPPGKPRPRWPTNFAWLIRMLPYEAACFGSQLQHQFSQPEMMALLEAAPQAGRLLRPLCRMLAIDLPPALHLPPRPPRPPKPKPPGPATSHRPTAVSPDIHPPEARTARCMCGAAGGTSGCPNRSGRPNPPEAGSADARPFRYDIRTNPAITPAFKPRR
jgi:hypothetical protein